MQSQITVEFIKENPKERFNQCDLLKDVSIISQGDIDEEEKAVIIETNLEYALVVNQDCDLEQDYNIKKTGHTDTLDKLLPNILILPAYTAAKFRDGKHRGERIKSMQWNSDKWSTIKSNQNPRFHYIKLNEKFQVPELVIDFKHVYTLNRELAYKGIKTFYFISMAELFREQISQRYTNYLGRIGLPDQSVA